MTIIPIKKTSGIELIPAEKKFLCHVRLVDMDYVNDLPWDRYVRLKASAEAVKRLVRQGARILDIGGTVGGPPFFLPPPDKDAFESANHFVAGFACSFEEAYSDWSSSH